MKTCLISRPARKDFQEIHDYYAETDPDTALDVLTHLQLVCDKLAQMPHLGRQRDELRKGLRSFPVEDHIIFYQTIGSDIKIVRVLHSARNISAIFSK